MRRPRLLPAQPAHPRNLARLLLCLREGREGKRVSGELRPRAPLPFLIALALRASPSPRPGTQGARPAPGHVCPGYCGPWTRAAPIPLGLRPPAGLTLLPIFLCPPSPVSGLSFFLVRCSLPSLYQQDVHCPPCPSSSGPDPTTSAPSQCKGVGGGEGKSSRWLSE